MNKITYLFGAGASCNALPIVNEIPERLREMAHSLDENTNDMYRGETYHKVYSNLNRTNKDHYRKMIKLINWLYHEAYRHASIDTFAKKLWLKEEYKDLMKLKIGLSIFFTIEQAVKDIDMRYDVFFASILDDIKTLPSNITILSWNYDVQFELAYSEFVGEQELSKLQDYLGVNSNHLQSDSAQKFSVFKLNGTTGLLHRGNNEYKIFINNLKNIVGEEFIAEITNNYYRAIQLDTYNSPLKFAWETKGKENLISRATEKIKDSVALVVIGYSFPFFNRDVDRKILHGMEHLKRVYLQDPEPQILKERFQAIRPDITDDKIVLIEKCEQFYLPNEL